MNEDDTYNMLTKPTFEELLAIINKQTLEVSRRLSTLTTSGRLKYMLSDNREHGSNYAFQKLITENKWTTKDFYDECARRYL